MKFKFFTLLSLSMLFLSNGYAEDYRTWNLPEGATMRIGKGRINALRFSPDGNELAVASSIGIWMYNMDTGAEFALFTGHTARIQKLAFSPDGKTLASTSNDSTIRLWNTDTGQQLMVLSDGQNLLSELAFSPDSTTIAGGSQTGVQLWDVATGDLLTTLTGHTDTVEALAFYPMEKCLQAQVRIHQFDCGISVLKNNCLC